MYIVTCNELRGLNDYILNRPGRFHYHFRFEYPTATEIREYMEDKLEKKTVFVIFDCDEWKSKSSMRLIMVSDEKLLESKKLTDKQREALRPLLASYDYAMD